MEHGQKKNAKRPDALSISICDENGTILATNTVDAATDWKTVFAGMPYDDAEGAKINYSIKAPSVSKYSMDVTKDSTGDGFIVSYTLKANSSTSEPDDGLSPLCDEAVVLGEDATPYQKGLFANENETAAKALQELLDAVHNEDGSVNLAAAREFSSDIQAWLKLCDSSIDLPILQDETNSFYQNHLFNGSANRHGALFMDCNNCKDFTDRNTIIYGKSMGDGTMFSDLLLYTEQSFFDAHPTFTLTTADGVFMIELFAGFTMQGDFDKVACLDFSDDADFLNYFNACIERSDFSSKVKLNADDHVITLVTGAYTDDNANYFLMGRIVPAD